VWLFPAEAVEVGSVFQRRRGGRRVLDGATALVFGFREISPGVPPGVSFPHFLWRAFVTQIPRAVQFGSRVSTIKH